MFSSHRQYIVEEVQIGNLIGDFNMKKASRMVRNEYSLADPVFKYDSYPEVCSFLKVTRQRQAQICIWDMSNHLNDKSVKTSMEMAHKRYTYLLAVRTQIRNLDLDGRDPRSLKMLSLQNFMTTSIFCYFDDLDVKVRQMAGECIEDMYRKMGLSYYVKIKPPLILLIKSRMMKKQQETNLYFNKSADQTSAADASKRLSVASDSILSWHYKCLLALAKQLQKDFVTEMDDLTLTVIFISWSYRNPAIREIGYNIANEIVKTGMIGDLNYRLRFVTYLVQGLTDDFSLVRMACGIAVKNMCLALKGECREEFYSLVIPPLCLSRHCVGDTKFMLFSQSAWREIMENRGIFFATRHISDIVPFYLSKMKSPSLTLRIAVCNAMAELVTKIEWDVVSKYTSVILDSLEKTVSSDRRELSDAATLSFGTCVLKYPEPTRPIVDRLLPVFFAKLSNRNADVRITASSILAGILSVLGTDYGAKILSHIYGGLKRLSFKKASEPNSRRKESGGATKVKVVMKDKVLVNANRPAASSKQNAIGQPKSIYTVKPKAPWLIADGCIYLIGDLANNDPESSLIPPFLPAIVEASQHRHYNQHVVILESICKIIPLLAQAMKRQGQSQDFKLYLDDIFGIIFYVIELRNQYSAAAQGCLHQLGKIFGASIIQGRVAAYNQNYMEHLKYL